MPTKNPTHHGLVILLLILAIDLVYVGTLFSIGAYAGAWERTFGDLTVFTSGLSVMCQRRKRSAEKESPHGLHAAAR